jgi:hypothetical protein
MYRIRRAVLCLLVISVIVVVVRRVGQRLLEFIASDNPEGDIWSMQGEN